MTKTEVDGEDGAHEMGDYLQVFLYRIPKENHDAMVAVQGQLKGVFKKHGTLSSKYFQLNPTEPFKGFTTLAKSISSSQAEELWLELDFYSNREDRDRVMGRIAQDPEFRQLLGEELRLFSPGTTVSQNEFSRAVRA